MSTERAPKSGFAREAQEKIDSKYSEANAREVLEWIRCLTGQPENVSGDQDNVFTALRDGTTLCELMNVMQPGIITKMQKSKLAFRCMENINLFLEAAKSFGMPPTELFQTVDLWEKQNLYSVVFCLESLRRKSGKFENPSDMNESATVTEPEPSSVETTEPTNESESANKADKSPEESTPVKKNNKSETWCCFC